MATILARPFAAIATALVITFATVVAIPSSASAGDETPVIETSPDFYTMWASSYVSDLPVWKNDTGVQNDTYGFASLVALKKGDFGDDTKVKITGSGLTVAIDPTRGDDEDIYFEYKYEDKESGAISDWTPVTIDVKAIKPIKVTQPRRGRLKFINKNPAPNRCQYGSPRLSRPDGKFRVAANSSKVITIHRSVQWVYCEMGKYNAVTLERTLRGLKV